MLAYAGQAVMHATIAALVLEALLWLWRVQDPGERLRLRWVGLLSPFLTAAYVGLVPLRSTESFGVGWALFAGARWDALRVGPVGAATALTAVLAVLGLALYLRDAIPFLADRTVRDSAQDAVPETHPSARRLRARLDAGQALRESVPVDLTVIESSTPVLLCTGVDQPRIVASTAAVDGLTDEELEAAVAHELEHVRHRDPLGGWWLMAVRTLQCFNPAIQVLGRQAVVDIERRADVAVVRRGLGAPLASAIRRLAAGADAHSDLVLEQGRAGLAERVHSRAHRLATADRCDSLIDGRLPALTGLSLWHVGLAGATLSLVLFFVV